MKIKLTYKDCDDQMMKRIYLALIAVLVMSLISIPASAQTAEPKEVILYLFWGDGCPHCAKEKEFLQEIKPEYPNLVVHDYELYHHPENVALFKQFAKAYGEQASGVPATFIDGEMIVGYTDSGSTSDQLRRIIKRCTSEGCTDPLDYLDAVESDLNTTDSSVIDLPFFGNVDAAAVSLPALTVILGAADSFNPCAFFVLLFLLSMLIYAKSRKRMIIIGGTFIFFSGLIYFLFMAAWLNFFLIVGSIAVITTIAGVVAIVIGAINVKDFFFFQKGISLTLSDTAKPKLFEKMRGLLKADSMPSMLLGTIVLAVTANTYELLCTAGFPLVYTRVLTLHGLSTLTYYGYLALYNIIYIIPLLIIVAVFTITLGGRRLSEWQGRMLKLISGWMMFALGLVLIFKPALLNNVFASVGLIIGAIGLSAAIILLKKKFGKKET